MKEREESLKVLEIAVTAVLLAQLAFVLLMNIFRADTMIDFDSSSAYMHEMEMGSQGKLFPSEYSYQASLDLDGAAVISAILYRFTGDIFLARGIANDLVVLLYLYVVSSVLGSLPLSKTWKRFGILLFFIPYSVNILGYWRTMFAGGGFFAFRALVPLLIISLILDLESGKKLKDYAIKALLLLFIVFLTGLSSGAYVMLCAVFPLILWEAVRAFLKGAPGEIRSKRMRLGLAALLAAFAGIVLQKAVGFSSTADSKVILTSKKWIDAMLAAFAGIFELFGGLTVHEDVRLFSFEACGTAVDLLVTCIIITAVIYTVIICIIKKEIPDMNGYIFSLMLVNAMMFSFLDLRYGDTVFESRYHLIPMLPALFLFAKMLDDISKSARLQNLQKRTLQVLIVILFFASMLYGDAQWVYAKTALGSEKLKDLNRIMEEEGVDTAFIVGEDSKDLGRKLRVYSRDVHYIVVNDGAASAFRTTWGGTTRYLDNSMQAGKTAIIATKESYETLPKYLIMDMRYLRDYDGLGIYTAGQSRFDCVGGVVLGKDLVVDFPYSPGYSYENAELSDDGCLVMKEGDGSLNSGYPAADGVWDYTVFYDMPEKRGDALIDIRVGDDGKYSVKPDPAEKSVSLEGVSMTEGETVSFKMSGPEDMRIQRIVMKRKGEAP
ncbi:MAG: hypothetical protein IK139_06155 [Lachnospiraceae bacterium]|nr:hypothetical protein [Lachnospiraceae bacterium]